MVSPTCFRLRAIESHLSTLSMSNYILENKNEWNEDWKSGNWISSELTSLTKDATTRLATSSIKAWLSDMMSWSILTTSSETLRFLLPAIVVVVVVVVVVRRRRTLC